MEGAPEANQRFGVGMAMGLDQVGGYAQDAYPFAEVYAQAETRLAGWLYLGASGSYRQDLNNYNHALGGFQDSQAAGLAAQTFIGYDGRGFHISMGPWLYGSSRRRPDFRLRVLPYGVLRLRFGSQSGWHGRVQLGDAAPFTASGGYSARFLLGAPRWRNHQGAAGLYTSIGEKVLGITAMDEVRCSASIGWRFGVSLGAVMDHPGRIEAAVFSGAAW